MVKLKPNYDQPYSKTNMELVAKNGISKGTYTKRIHYGYSVDDAINKKPLKRIKSNPDLLEIDESKPKKLDKYRKPKPWLEKYPQRTEFGDYAQLLFQECCGSWSK